MRNLFYVLVATLFASLTGVCAAAAGQQYSTAGATFRPLDHDDNNGTVCCSRGGQRWWSDANRCYQAGGQPTRNDYCRQQGGYDGNGSGSYGGGYGYNDGYYNDPYGNPDRRVCCNSRYGIGWASWRQCRYVRGQDMMNKVCRKHKYGVDYNRILGGYNDGYNNGYGNGYGQDPYSNPHRRVCCKRGWRDWWSTWSECRRAGGYETANRECRRD